LTSPFLGRSEFRNGLLFLGYSPNSNDESLFNGWHIIWMLFNTSNGFVDFDRYDLGVSRINTSNVI
jgi:hypothetical protein